jgi:hypothetical protein
MFEYSKEAMRAVKEIDKYDLKPAIHWCFKNHKRIYYEVQDKIILEYPSLEQAIEDLTIDEFMEYLRQRYNIIFDEVSTYIMREQQ